jgi:cytochrome c-type biogenesis protein
LERLFVFLTHAVEGSPVVALSASFLWGILSVVLSPCHLSSIPLIVGFVSEQGDLTRRRALAVSGLFALGILVTIALIGGITAAMGRMLGDVGKYGNYFVAAIFFLVGLHLIGIIPMPWSSAGPAKMNRKGLFAAFLLGLLFGIALGPCTFAYMAPMLAVSFKMATKSLVYAVSLLLAYGAGHCAVIVFAGASTGSVQRYLNWNEKSKGVSVVKNICGVLVILGGVYMIYAVS